MDLGRQPGYWSQGDQLYHNCSALKDQCAIDTLAHSLQEDKSMARKPTIEELERLLDSEEDTPIEILPNGEIRALGGSEAAERDFKKPLTMREDLGGEYGRRGTLV